jgi:hypothetical protein
MTADSGPSNDATIPAIPNAGVSPLSLALGNVEVAATSAAQSVTVSNTGGAAPLNVTVAAPPSGDFTWTNGCTAPVAINATCTISVTLKPTALGARTGSLGITTNDPVHPSFTVSLSGNGVVLVAPSGLSGTAVRVGNTQTENVTLNWTDNSLGETFFEVQRATVNNAGQCNTTNAFSTVSSVVPAHVGTGAVTYQNNGAPRQNSLCYRVRALSSLPAANSAWSNRAYVTTP